MPPPSNSLAALIADAGNAERARRAQMGGYGASAPIADADDTDAIIAAMSAQPMPQAPAAPAAPPPGADPTLAALLAEAPRADLPPGVVDLDAIAQRRAEIEAQPPPQPAAPSAPTVQLAPGLTVDLGGAPIDSRQLTTGPAARLQSHSTAPQTAPRDVADLSGGAPPARGTRRGVGGAIARRRGLAQPAPPPTEEELNQAVMSILTNRPQGDAPLAPEDFRSPSELDGQSLAERQQSLIDDRQALEQRQAEQAAIRAAEAADAEARLEEQRAQVQAERQAALAGARRRYESALGRAAEMRIEPERFFKSRGVLGQIGASVAMAVGALGEGISGAPNRALAIIQGAVDRDIDAQRMAIDSARADAEGQRGVLALMRQEYDDQDAALEATRAAMLREAARRAEMEGASAASEDARLRAEALRTELEAQARAAEEGAAMREALRMLELRRNVAETVEAEGDARQSLANASRLERRLAGGGGARARRVSAEQMENYNRLINSGLRPADAAQRAGLDFVPPDGVFSTASNQEAAGLAALDEALRAIEARIPAEGEDIPGIGPVVGNLPNFLVSDEGEALREDIENAVDLIGRLRSGGAIGAEEEARFSRILGGTTTQSEGSLRRGLSRIRRELRGRVQRRVRTRGRGEELDRRSSAVGFDAEGGE